MLKSFQKFCEILIPTQILIEYTIMIMVCRALPKILIKIVRFRTLKTRKKLLKDERFELL